MVARKWLKNRMESHVSETDKPWPTEIRLKKDRKVLQVTFSNDESYEYSAEYLRVCAPSADVQGHSPDQKKTIPGKRNVEVLEIHPVGNYAVKLFFDDMFDNAIYSWTCLLAMGREHDTLWGDYLSELEQKGLSRDG